MKLDDSSVSLYMTIFNFFAVNYYNQVDAIIEL